LPFKYKDSSWYQKYQAYLPMHLLLIIDLFSKFIQALIQQAKNYLMNLCVQISNSMQQKMLMKNQQEVEVFFRHFLGQLVAWEYEKMLDRFNHPPHC